MTGQHHNDKHADRVVICPKCGRPTIDVRHYVGQYAGDVQYIHEGRVVPPFGLYEVTDSCYVAAKNAKVRR
jgi:4-hydroxy-3-methylbut-2-en-1-yl diphosphate synthase IspG/GcpE